jgi:hypothetical protein
MARTQIALAFGLVSANLSVTGQVVYQSEITDAVINSRTIDVSKPVGAVSGEAGVSAVGAATYTIPIIIPPGTNGMQPQLALAYNSNGGDGVLGIGWGIVGLSQIQRVGSDNYHDGVAAPVSFTSADHYALDGQRLVNVNNSNYQSSSYDTEVAQFKFYNKLGNYGSGPAGFSGIGKDGITSYYGMVDSESESALVKRSSNNEALGWLLSKIVDTYGNEVRYNYSTGLLNEAKRLISINYTSNPGQGIAAYNSIVFTYNTRIDKTTLFQSGSEIKNEYLLERIDVKAEGALMMSYPLMYAVRQNNSYLCEIGQFIGGNSLNTTIIKYGESPNSIESTSSLSSFSNNASSDLFTSDFDGNGKSDILYSNYVTTNGQKNQTSFDVYMNGSSQSTYSYQFNSSDFNQIATYGGGESLIAADYNGDGRDDIMITRMHWHSPKQVYFFTGALLFLSTSTSNDAEFSVSDIGRPDLGASNNSFSFFSPDQGPNLVPGDYDGDGRTEVVISLVTANDQGGTPHLSMWDYNGTVGSWVGQTIEQSQIDGFKHGTQITSLDINGDGKAELAYLSRYSTTVPPTQISAISTLFINMSNLWSGPGIITYKNTWSCTLFPGDFNGDGASDLLTRTNNTWSIHTSDGGILGPETNISMNGTDPVSVKIADINGDGRADILQANATSNGPRLNVRISSGFNNNPQFLLSYIDYFGNQYFKNMTIGDFNGDGKSDLLNRNDPTLASDLYFFFANSQERRVDIIMNGMNATVNFDWKYMTDNSIYSDLVSIYEYPKHDVQFALPLVSTVSSSNGTGGTNSINHSYGNAWGWSNGPGFVGFENHVMVNPVANRINYEKNTPASAVATMLPGENWEYLLSPIFTPISHSVFSPAVNLLQNNMKRFSIHMLNKLAVDHLSGSQVSTVNTGWDAADNLLQSVVTTAGVGSQQTNITYGSLSYYSLAKPTLVSVSTTRTGSPTEITESAYSYNYVTGALTQKIEFNNKPIKTTTDYLYFPTGNIQKSTLSYTGLPVNDRRIDSWTYDPKYRYPSTSTMKWNNNGTLVDVTESFEYDKRWGKITKHTSTDLLVSDHVFDVFGRETSVSAPYLAGTPRYNITKQYTWDVTGTKVWYDTTTDPRRTRFKGLA